MIVRDSRTPRGRLENSGGPSNYIALLETIGLGDTDVFKTHSWHELGRRYSQFMAAAKRQGYVKPPNTDRPVKRERPVRVAKPRSRAYANPLLCRPQIHPKASKGRCLPCKRARHNEFMARKRLHDVA